MTPLGLALRGALVLAAAALAVRALHGAPAAWRHSAWTVAFGTLIALPALALAGLSWRVAVLPASTGAAVAPGAALPVSTVALWLGAVWALGAVAVALRWIVAHAAARRLVRMARPIRSARWRRAEHAARRAMGLRLPVRLLTPARLDVPAAWGVRPSQRAILLPRSARTWDAGRRRAVLLHEMAHLRRGDLWTQVLAQAAVAVHWFNPLVWRAYRAALAERELACDDAALRAGADPADYAGHLLALARTLRPRHAALAAVASMAERPALERRIVSILMPRDCPAASRLRTLATAGSALAFVLAVVAVEPVQRDAEAPLVAAAPVAVAEVPAPVAPVVEPPTPPAPPETPPAPPEAPSAPPEAPAAPAARALPTPSPAPAPAVARRAPAAAPRPAPAPLAFKAVDPDHITRQVAQLRATVAALHDLDPEALSHQSVDAALAAVPDLPDADRAVIHAEALANLAQATAAAERRLFEAETLFESDRRGGQGARGPAI